MPLIDLPNVNQVDVPTGIIQIWTGTLANIPSGWGLCDGLGGRPNLLDRFVRGVNTPTTEPGTTGGLATVTLSTAQLTSHGHGITGGSTHNHTVPLGTSSGSTGVRVGSATTGGNSLDLGDNSFPIPVSPSTGFTGSNLAHNNMPPFFEVAYIIKE